MSELCKLFDLDVKEFVEIDDCIGMVIDDIVLASSLVGDFGCDL